MTRGLRIVTGIALTFLIASPAVGQTQMASVRELYASASYEDALSVLASVNGTDTAIAIEAEQYRALCLLAIGRQSEARASVRRIVERDPLYVPVEAEVTPRIATLFAETRRELLPGVARKEFAAAKALFERQEHQQAIEQLDRVARITSDPAVKDVDGLDDLHLVADGLLTLARAKAAAAAAARTVSLPAPVPTLPPAPIVYGGDDPRVTVPVAMVQDLPPWRSPGNLRRGTVLSGLVRLIIDETGKVESVTLLRAIHTSYDAALLRAAQNWTFTPALKDGQPVKYAKVIEVQLQAQE
ncbi:MAG: energy transducer TonB [Vicinamibacterales bacterium]